MKIIVGIEKKETGNKVIEELKKLGEKYDKSLEIIRCAKGDALTFHMKDNPNGIDLIIIDTDFFGEDGILTATRFRNQGYDNEIVFLTKNKEKVFDSFEAEPLNYILINSKNIVMFEKTFLKVIKKMERKKEDMLSLSCAGETRNIRLSDINYFQSEGRIVAVHYGKKETFKFYSPVGKLENILEGRGFVRTHRSMIVNLFKIKSLNSKDIILKNGDVCYVGGKYYKNIKEELTMQDINSGRKQ